MAKKRTRYADAVRLGRATERLFPDIFAAERRDPQGGAGVCECEGGRRILAHNRLAADLGIRPVEDVELHRFPTPGNLAAFLGKQKVALGGTAFEGDDQTPLNPSVAAEAITSSNDASEFAAAREAYYAFMLPNLKGAPTLADGQTWCSLVDAFDDSAAPARKSAAKPRRKTAAKMKATKKDDKK